MSERFLKFIPSDEAFWLMQKRPNAFYLLTHIANTARRYNGHPDGLTVGQCHLQKWTKYGFTEREYRTAKEILGRRNHIKIIETNRTRQKSTNGTTTVSTLVEIISLTVYDINSEKNDDRNDDRATTDRRQTRKNKKEKEDHPSIPSGRSDRMTDDFSSKSKIEICQGVFLTQRELDACIQLKGDVEKVKHAIEFIQSSKQRSYEITDWPNALAKWKIDNKAKVRIEDHLAFAEKLCKTFENYDDGHGWRCYFYNDPKRDQRGLLFESQSAYKEAIFIALADGEFKQKCEEAMKKNKMKLLV
jgi:hypothetical protein